MRTVAFDSQGGSFVLSETVAFGSLAMEPNTPSWSAHALEGWFKEPDCMNRWDFTSDTVTEDVTLYAKWLVCTEGLSYTLINGNTAYSVKKERVKWWQSHHLPVVAIGLIPYIYRRAAFPPGRPQQDIPYSMGAAHEP
jgi:hypothetical protein